jgi:hypothetical protein
MERLPRFTGLSAWFDVDVGLWIAHCACTEVEKYAQAFISNRSGAKMFHGLG